MITAPYQNSANATRQYPSATQVLLFSSLLLVLLTPGCANEVGHFTPLKQGYAAKSAIHPIDVFTNGLPTRAFERVAILDVHCESQGWMTPNLEHDALPVLMKQARAAGCDAIIEIKQRKPANWTFETKSLHFSAVGVAYK